MHSPLPEDAIRLASRDPILVGSTEHSVSISSVALLSSKSPADWPSISQALNVAFGVAMDKSGMRRIGRSYFFLTPLSDKYLDEMASKILVLPGFFTELSFKLLGGKPCISLIVDPTSKVLSRTTVLDTISAIQEEVPTKQLLSRLEVELYGQVIMTKYDYQSYILEEVDYDMSPMSSFHLDREDRDITFLEYYKLKGITIRYEDQPLIKVTSRQKTIYLIPELCLLTTLDPKVKADVPKVCSIKPPDRVLRMSCLLDLLEANKDSQNLLKKFSIAPQKAPINTLKTATAKAPRIQIVGSESFNPVEGGWGPRTKGLKFGKTLLPDLKLLVTVEDGGRNDYKPIIEDIQRELTTKNAVASVQVKYIVVPRNAFHSSVLTDGIKQVLKSGSGFWIAILDKRQNNKAKYEDVKTTSLNEQLKSQCLTEDKLWKTKGFIIANLMKQIVNKMGFLCWTVDLVGTCPSLPNETLFVGIDVYHAPKVFSKGKTTRRSSVAAFVAVFLKNGSFQFFNDVSVLEGGKELHGQRDNNEEKTDYLKKFLRRIAEEHKIVPKQVIVYRDGVGDGQMEIVKGTEVIQVQAAFPKTLVDFVVVKKRIHNKFIVAKEGNYFNPAPGTVVNDLQNVDEKDAFYLISTSSTISTVKPVHYVFLIKQSQIPMADFQNLTFALCHLYPNWPDAIKLPLPTQLAHKLAWQVGECFKPRDTKDNKQLTMGPSLFKSMHYL